MRISIAMATYNGADFLRQQLDSFASQTRLPDELVVTDDLSGDATPEIVSDFAQHAPFTVRFESNERRLGPAMNFDRALSLCTGDLVLLSDQDDVWLPDKIERLANAAIRDADAACWMNDAFLTDMQLRPVGRTKMEQIAAAGLPETMMVMGCCAAFRRDLLDLLLPIPTEQPAHDNWLIGVSDLLSLVRRYPVALQYYRRHGGNVSNFFVNRIDAPGWFERLLSPARSLMARVFAPGGLRLEQQLQAAAAERLWSRAETVRSLVGNSAAETILRRSADRARVLSDRQRVRELPRTRRIGSIWRLLRSGGYGTPANVAAALKDMVVVPSERHGWP